MKKILFYLVIFLPILYNCTKEVKIPIPDLNNLSQIDSLILLPNVDLQFKANTPALYTLLGKVDAKIDTSGMLNVGASEGFLKVVAINKQNPKDSLVQTVFILKQAELLTALKTGGHILSFRHANASLGSDKTSANLSTNWWKSCDQTLARQITPSIGYQECDSTGQVLKKLKIKFDTLMTSEFCRCKQTAESFNLGLPIKEYKELTFSVYDEANRYGNIMKLYQSKPIGVNNYIAIGHAGFTSVPTPEFLNTLQWGDCQVFKQVANESQPKSIGRITVRDWGRMAKSLK